VKYPVLVAAIVAGFIGFSAGVLGSYAFIRLNSQATLGVATHKKIPENIPQEEFVVSQLEDMKFTHPSDWQAQKTKGVSQFGTVTDGWILSDGKDSISVNTLSLTSEAVESILGCSIGNNSCTETIINNKSFKVIQIGNKTSMVTVVDGVVYEIVTTVSNEEIEKIINSVAF